MKKIISFISDHREFAPYVLGTFALFTAAVWLGFAMHGK